MKAASSMDIDERLIPAMQHAAAPKRGVGGFAGTVHGVDVRIGVTQAPREISVEVDDDNRDDVKSKVEAALSGATDVLWITDKRGRDIGVPAAKIAYVEVGSADGDRRIGFGG
jgi:hypothetical protein